VRIVLWIVVTLFGALTLLGFLGRVWWPLELASFFRPWYAGLLALAAVLALPFRSFAVALAALVLVAVNVAVVALAIRDRPSYPRALAGSRVKVLLANLYARNDDYGRVAALIRRERPDVIGLTELTPAWSRALGGVLARYRSRAVAPRPGPFGIGLYGRVPLDRTRLEPFAPGAPNAAVASLALAGRPVTLVLVHPPFPFTAENGTERRDQLEAIGDLVASGRLGRNVAICGDLNAPPWTWAARRLVSRAAATDIARGDGFEGTWPRWLPAPLRLPLDTCLLSDGVTLLSRSAGPNVGSDHLPLIVELGAAESVPRSGERDF
jgi:endonuclease/exonuclease/phosphatase (EEP) superfamily protein YafD